MTLQSRQRTWTKKSLYGGAVGKWTMTLLRQRIAYGVWRCPRATDKKYEDDVAREQRKRVIDKTLPESNRQDVWIWRCPRATEKSHGYDVAWEQRTELGIWRCLRATNVYVCKFIFNLEDKVLIVTGVCQRARIRGSSVIRLRCHEHCLWYGIGYNRCWHDAKDGYVWYDMNWHDAKSR